MSSPATSTPWVPVWPLGGAGEILTTKPGYGTALPTSPADGDEFILVDSVTAPSYQWRFRYNAQSAHATQKWDYVGGLPWEVFVSGAQAFTLTSSLQFLGASITIPRAGLWRCTFGFRVTAVPAAAFVMEYGINAGILYPLAGAGTGVTVGAAPFQSVELGLAAATVMNLQAKCPQGGSWTFDWRTVSIEPRRVA